jgi:endonuclease/exonuclease/phosphatase family metal-dependent hydrolase
MADRYCSVPRNDPRNQAMQPKPRQVEWAVDQAVRGVLTVSRPANWKNLGMGAYTPQTMLPPVPLDGGGFVPAQVMLGIAAQESNLWQAARYAVPGVTANPLIGNYYGIDIYNGTETDDWTIRFDHADCGYGVMQVTDGMRLLGREKDPVTDRARPYEEQRAIALDFAANIAAGLQILQRKWNQTRSAGLTINNGSPSKIENWYFAVWAYNSGFYPQSGAAENDGAWGVGWANNPANPKYPANRGSFLETDTYRDDYADAAHPQDWPYPEKVMGWAGHPVEVLEAPDTLVAGYRAAWWSGDSVTAPRNRHHVIPPHDMFCDFSNNCDFGSTWLPDDPEVIGEPAGPCAHRNAAGRIDLKCWYHRSAGWKPDCASTCGNELLRFDPGYAYQEDGTAYPPRCDLSGLPAGARVVDNLASWIPSVRPNCPRTANAGDFQFDFRENAAGQRPGKIDTHQLGMGFGGHFWMSNARTSDALQATGRWRFDQTFSGLAKVYVHLPQLNNGTTQARYHIKTQFGVRQSVVRQQGAGNRWIPIGTYMFNGVPEISLSTVTLDGNGSQRIAWDAVALVPVAGMKTIKMLDWNVAGAADHFGDTSVIDRLVTEVQDRQPEVLTLNEVCENQYEYLLDRLTDIGYQMAGTFSTAEAGNLWCVPGDPTAKLNVGNVVLVRGTVTAAQKFIFGVDNKLYEGGIPIPEVTKRSVACVTARLPGADRDVKFCATHLQKGYPTDQTAAVQVRELARVFGPEAQQSPLVIAGDTNIPTPPTDAGIGPLYGAPLGTGDFWEVEQERVCITLSTCELFQGGQATYADRKLDYVFASRWHLYVPIGRAIVNRDVGTCDGIPCSDHYFVHSQVILPTP